MFPPFASVLFNSILRKCKLSETILSAFLFCLVLQSLSELTPLILCVCLSSCRTVQHHSASHNQNINMKMIWPSTFSHDALSTVQLDVLETRADRKWAYCLSSVMGQKKDLILPHYIITRSECCTSFPLTLWSLSSGHWTHIVLENVSWR